MFLDCVRLIQRGGIATLEGLANGGGVKPPDPQAQKALNSLEWDIVLRNGNRWYDRLVAAMRLKDRAAREKQLGDMEEELKELKRNVAGAGDLARLFLGKEPDKVVARAVGDVLISMLVPATRKVQSASDRIEQVQRNLRLAFALAAHQREHGGYPMKLDELAPKYLAQVPGDIFSGKAVIYRPSEKGYLLYSVGVNGKDEEGRWVDDTPPGDDPRVRMPLPELKKK
jgi:hypothetical protein